MRLPTTVGQPFRNENPFWIVMEGDPYITGIHVPSNGSKGNWLLQLTRVADSRSYIPHYYRGLDSFQCDGRICLRQHDAVPGGCVWAEGNGNTVPFDNVIRAADVCPRRDTCNVRGAPTARYERQSVHNCQDCASIGGDVGR